MKFSISISSLTLLILPFTTTTNAAPYTYEGYSCDGDDPISCSSLGVCVDGIKNYHTLLGTDVGNLPSAIRGMHCECPDDSPNAKNGYTGVHCTTEFERCEDNSICFNGGYCMKDSHTDRYHCACPSEEGYAGRTCESKPLSKDGYCNSSNDPFFVVARYPWFCVNGGVCRDGIINMAEKCQCEPGFAGVHCEYLESEYEVCSLDCSGVGECKKGALDASDYIDKGLDIEEYLGGSNINGEHCVCPKGYTGVNCQFEAKEDNFRHCGSGVCFNGGICVERVSESGKAIDYHCECNEFDTLTAGEFCEHADVEFCPFPPDHDPASYYCANGGRCPLEGNEHQPCVCDEGWTGSRCEVRVEHEEVKCDLKCENGGTCFFGDNPIQDDSLKTIPGLEFLQDNKHCRCPAGYIGLRCEMRYERCGGGQHYCLHGAGCVEDNDQFTCDCNEVSTELVAYAGHYCQHTAAEFCQGPGAGKHSFCTKHGTCRGEIGMGQDHVGCDCEAGWTGDYCEYQLDQLQTNGIATEVFVAFVVGLIALLLTVGVCFCVRTGKNRSGTYATTAVRETHVNPYGDEEEEEEDEYELKEVTII